VIEFDSRQGSAENMEQACTGCGYRSGNRSFFRREKSGVFGRRNAFCHGCAPYRPTRLERLSVHSLWIFMAGALLVVSGLEGPPHGIGYFWVFLGAMGLSGAVLIKMGEHERGLALLTEGIRGVAGMDDKARFAPFLARGERARGNTDLGAEFEKLGRHLSALLGPK